ncbi:MAG: hypothetical protein A2915_01610 [Candidatus Yanofskybacteria bacterium RIFCSPLOWO2_01_FULL_41_34]|nr:MAG: hypothetical protein A2915_01610 [Candidatus Yanofskybacteria bacterium RIFCSPLOWO2_01_FULL_41_34]
MVDKLEITCYTYCRKIVLWQITSGGSEVRKEVKRMKKVKVPKAPFDFSTVELTEPVFEKNEDGSRRYLLWYHIKYSGLIERGLSWDDGYEIQEHPELYPDSWKSQPIFLWNTLSRHSEWQVVSALFWINEKVVMLAIELPWAGDDKDFLEFPIALKPVKTAKSK